MKTRTPAIVLATAALVAATASPASAAVVYTTTPFSIPNASGAIAVDTSTLTIYAGQTAPDGSTSVAVIDGKTRKVTATIPITPALDQPSIVPVDINEIEVNSRTHTVWVNQPWAGRADFGYVYSIDGATKRVTHEFSTASHVTRIQVDHGSNYAYAADSSEYDGGDFRDDGSIGIATLAATGHVYSFNSATGATASAALPAPTTADCGYVGTYVYYPQNSDIAFNSSNYGLYVASSGYLWAYTNKLKLAHTTKLPYSQCDTIGVAADATTTYVTDDHAITTVAASTGTIAKTTTFTGATGRPVIDKGVSALYLGTSVITTSTLKKTGTLPSAAVAVNTGSHTVYAVAGKTGYLVKRTTN